jgi:hypothetical protein
MILRTTELYQQLNIVLKAKANFFNLWEVKRTLQDKRGYIYVGRERLFLSSERTSSPQLKNLLMTP